MKTQGEKDWLDVLFEYGYTPSICGITAELGNLPDNWDFIVQRIEKPYKPKTNYDRLTHMSAEELANLFSEMVDCERGCDARKEKCWMTESTCRRAWLDWLKEEAKK